MNLLGTTGIVTLYALLMVIAIAGVLMRRKWDALASLSPGKEDSEDGGPTVEQLTKYQRNAGIGGMIATVGSAAAVVLAIGHVTMILLGSGPVADFSAFEQRYSLARAKLLHDLIKTEHLSEDVYVVWRQQDTDAEATATELRKLASSSYKIVGAKAVGEERTIPGGPGEESEKRYVFTAAELQAIINDESKPGVIVSFAGLPEDLDLKAWDFTTGPKYVLCALDGPVSGKLLREGVISGMVVTRGDYHAPTEAEVLVMPPRHDEYFLARYASITPANFDKAAEMGVRLPRQ